MDKKTIQTIGSVLLIAGLVFGSIGAHRIATDFSIFDEEVQGGESLGGNVEFQVWKSAL